MVVAEVEIILSGNDKGAQAAMDRTKAGMKAMGESAKSTEKPVDDLNGRFVALAKEITTGTTGAATTVRTQLGGAAKQVAGDAKAAGEAVKDSMRKAGDSADDAAKRLKTTASTLATIGSTAHTAGIGLSASLTAPLLLAAKAGLQYAGDFEQSMNVFKVTAHATAAQMDAVGAAAKRLGNDERLSNTTATDAAHAMLELAKAGLSVKDTLGASQGVLQLSAAAQIDNATAAKIAAEALMSFGLAGTKANMVSDLLAAAANASTASMTEIADGLAQSSAVYAHAKISIQDLTTGLAMLSNAGIKGSDAGTSMKTMLLSLENPTKEAAAQMKTLGVSVYDAQGKMLPFKTIIHEFEVATKGLTARQRDHAMATVFGSDAVRAANVIMGEGIDKFNALQKAVTEQGAAAKQADALNKGFKGALEGAKSAGQTMLQDFIEPALPKLTDFFKSVSHGLNDVDGWSPGMKDAARGTAIFLGALGPTALAVKGITTVTKGFIGLKDLLTGAEKAKALALTVTGAAADKAAISVTAEATATDAAAASAIASEAALGGEAAAMDGVGASAIAAEGKVGMLRGAMLGLRGLSLPLIGGIGAYVVAKKFGDDLEKDAHDARAGNAKGFADYTRNQNAKALGFLHRYGKKELLAQAGTYGSGMTLADGQNAIKADEEQKTAAMYGQYSASRLASRQSSEAAQTAKQKAADAAEEMAARHRQDAVDTMAGQKKGRGGRGGGGKSGEDSALSSAARELKQEYIGLTGQLYEAQKAKALLGKSSEALSLIYDIQHGKINGVNVAHAQEVVAALKSKEAVEAHTEAQKRAKEVEDEFAKDRQQHYANMALQQSGLSELDQESLSLFQKHYANLTSEENKKRVLWAVDEARAKLTKENRDAGAAFAKDTIDGLTHELAAKTAISRVDQTLLAIAEERKKGHVVTDLQELDATDAAEKLDIADKADKAAEAWKRLREIVVDTMAKAAGKADADSAAAFGRYADSIAELNARLTDSGTESEKYRARLVKLAESFGTGATAADRIASGMDRAETVMRKTMAVDRVEAFRTKMKGVADTVGDYFAKMATGVDRSFSFSFKGILSGFGSMLADMARQEAGAAIKSGVSGLLTSVLGGAFGGKTGVTKPSQLAGINWAAAIPGHATGGPVLSGVPIRVGENGPETFVPAGNGSIATAAQTKGAGGNRPVHVTVNVSAPNPGAFHESAPQIALKMGAAIQSAMRQLG